MRQTPPGLAAEAFFSSGHGRDHERHPAGDGRPGHQPVGGADRARGRRAQPRRGRPGAHRHPVARRLPGAAAAPVAPGDRRGSAHPLRRRRHHPLSRRSRPRPPDAVRAGHGHRVPDRGSAHPAGRRRPLHRTHDPGGHGRAGRLRPPAIHPARGPRRSRASRAPHPRRLRRQNLPRHGPSASRSARRSDGVDEVVIGAEGQREDRP